MIMLQRRSVSKSGRPKQSQHEREQLMSNRNDRLTGARSGSKRNGGSLKTARKKRAAIRLGLKGASFLAAAFLFMASYVCAASDVKLTIAMLRSATQTPFYVAVESGLYRHYGLEIVPVQFSGGTQATYRGTSK